MQPTRRPDRASVLQSVRKQKHDELRQLIYDLPRVQICKSFESMHGVLGTYGLDGYRDTMFGDATYFF